MTSHPHAHHQPRAPCHVLPVLVLELSVVQDFMDAFPTVAISKRGVIALAFPRVVSHVDRFPQSCPFPCALRHIAFSRSHGFCALFTHRVRRALYFTLRQDDNSV